MLALPQGSGFDLSAYLVPIVAFSIAIVALAFGVRKWRRDAGPPDRDGPAPTGPSPRTPSGSTPTSPATTSERPQASRRRRERRAWRPAAAAAPCAARGPRARRWAGETPARSASAAAADRVQRPAVAVVRRAGEDDQVVGAAQFRGGVAEALGAEHRRRVRRRGAGADADQRRRCAGLPPGRRGPAAAGSAPASPPSAGTRAGRARPRARARPPAGAARDRTRAAPCGGRRRWRRAARATAPQGAAAAGEDDDPVLGQLRQQGLHRLEVGPAQGPDPRLAGRRAGELGEDGQLGAPAAHHIRSGAEIPSSPSAPEIVRFAQRHSASREASTPSPSAPTTWQSR